MANISTHSTVKFDIACAGILHGKLWKTFAAGILIKQNQYMYVKQSGKHPETHALEQYPHAQKQERSSEEY